MISWVGEFEVPEGVEGDETAAGISSGYVIAKLTQIAATNDGGGTAGAATYISRVALKLCIVLSELLQQLFENNLQ